MGKPTQTVDRATPRPIAEDSIEARYIDLIERTVVNSIYGESSLETAIRAIWQRLRHPVLTRRGALRWPARAHSMIGTTRMRHLRQLVETTIVEDIPGDYIETGVWRGGACILMRGVLKAYGIGDRRVFCADSFKGLPRPSCGQDKPSRLYAFDELAVSLETVRRNFEAYGLLDDQVVFMPGLFKDTLPKIVGNPFAIIRLDGDMYESTMDALTNLYDGVSPRGFVIVDDYGGLAGCRRAVHDFIDRRNLPVDIKALDDSCVWWRKPS